MGLGGQVAEDIPDAGILGTLPAEGTVCQPDELPFGLEVEGRLQVLSPDEDDLLSAVTQLSEAFASSVNIGL